MRVVQAQLMVLDETIIDLAEELRALCDSHLVVGADVVVYNVEQNPQIADMISGGFRWDDRTLQ